MKLTVVSGYVGVQMGSNALIEREIVLKQEYRTFLTAELVTTKLDLCEAAADKALEETEEIEK